VDCVVRSSQLLAWMRLVLTDQEQKRSMLLPDQRRRSCTPGSQ